MAAAGAGDVVLDPVVGGPGTVEVELQPGRTRIAVPWLTDAAGVDQPLALAEIEFGAVGPGLAGGRLAREAREGQRDVGVTDQAIRCACTSRHSSACSGESTYSQTGSRGLAW